MNADRDIGLLQADIGSAIKALSDRLETHPEDIVHVDRRWLRNDAYVLRQVIEKAEAALAREAA